VRIPDPGEQVVFVEDPPGATGFVDGASLSVTAPDGSAVPLDRYGSSLTYETDAHEGTAVASFDAAVAGDYRIVADGVGGLAIGEDFGGAIIRTILVAVVIAGAAVMVGLTLVVVTVVRRSRFRSRQRSVQPAPGGPPPAWGPGGGLPPPPPPPTGRF
jgi:hypothetical protein